MRSFVRAVLLAVALSPIIPEPAYCQDVEQFDDGPPRAMARRGRPWRRSPVVWGTVAVVLAVAIPYSLYKLYCGMRQWTVDQAREKEPWERAMAEAERNRVQ